MATILTSQGTFLGIHKGLWFQRVKGNFVKVINTCGQQSSTDGIAVIFFNSNSNYKPLSYFFILISKDVIVPIPFQPFMHEISFRKVNHNGLSEIMTA